MARRNTVTRLKKSIAGMKGGRSHSRSRRRNTGVTEIAREVGQELVSSIRNVLPEPLKNETTRPRRKRRSTLQRAKMSVKMRTRRPSRSKGGRKRSTGITRSRKHTGRRSRRAA